MGPYLYFRLVLGVHLSAQQQYLFIGDSFVSMATVAKSLVAMIPDPESSVDFC
jgi:hypothetical protein